MFLHIYYQVDASLSFNKPEAAICPMQGLPLDFPFFSDHFQCE